MAEPGSDRRTFLRAGAGAAMAAGALGTTGVLAAPASASHGHGRGRRRSLPLDKIGIQLFTVRSQLSADVEGTLATLAEIGYRIVEHAGFAGRTAAQFRTALDNAGLRSTSGHQGIPQPFDAGRWAQTVNDAVTVGQRKIVHPVGPSARTRAGWQAFAEDLNRAADIAHSAGLHMGYHNHQFEFARLEDTTLRGYDVLLDEIDTRRVHLEVDLFWSWRGTQDPVVLFQEQRRQRFLQFHVKDMGLNGSFTDVGAGLIDFARIFDDAPGDVDDIEYIVERDDAGATALTQTARVSYEYLRDLRF